MGHKWYHPGFVEDIEDTASGVVNEFEEALGDPLTSAFIGQTFGGPVTAILGGVSGFQAQARRAERQAGQAQQRFLELQRRRQAAALQRTARQARGRIENIAAARGIAGSSTAELGIGATTGSLAGELSFLEKSASLNDFILGRQEAAATSAAYSQLLLTSLDIGLSIGSLFTPGATSG